MATFESFFWKYNPVAILLSWSYLILALYPMAALSHSESLPNITIRNRMRKNWYSTTSLFSLIPLVFPIVNLSLSHAGTSNQIKTGCRELQYLMPCMAPLVKETGTGVYSHPSTPYIPLIIPSRNRREEERPASVTQRRYNNRKKTGQLIRPKPFRNLGSRERL